MRSFSLLSLMTSFAMMSFVLCPYIDSVSAKANITVASTSSYFHQEQEKEDEKKEDEKEDEKKEGDGGAGQSTAGTNKIGGDKGNGPTKPGSKNATGGGSGAGTRSAGTNKIGEGKGEGPAKPGSKNATGGGSGAGTRSAGTNKIGEGKGEGPAKPGSKNATGGGSGAGTRSAGTNKIGGGEGEGPAKPGSKNAVGGGSGAGTRSAGTNKIGEGKGEGPAMPGSKNAVGGGNGAGTRSAGTNKIGGGDGEGPAKPGSKNAVGGGNGAGTRSAGTNKIGGGDGEGPAKPGSKNAVGGGNGAGTRSAGTNKIGGGDGEGPARPGSRMASGGGNGAGTRSAGTNKIGGGDGEGPARPGARAATGGSGAGSRSAGANRIGDDGDFRNRGGNPSENPTRNSRSVDPSQPVESQNWYDMAVYSFENGQESNGFRYLYGHVLAEEKGMETEMSWVTGIREPRVATRWGVGIQIDAANNFTGDPPLVGEVPVLPNNSRRQQTGPEPGSTPYKDINKDSVRGNFIYYTGELGERLLQQLDQRRQDQSAWGPLLKGMPGEAVQISELPAGDANGRAGGNRSGPRDGAATMRGVPQAGSRGSNEQAVEFTSKSGTLVPGVLHLGVGTSAEILNSAAAEGIDVLVMFDIELSVNPRVGTRYNKTRMKLIRVKDGKVLRNGGLMDYIKIWQKRQRSANSKNDVVVNEIDKLFEVVDEGEYKLIKSQMPNISDEIAKQRVEHLTADSDSSELVRLIEIMKYYRGGMISKTFAVEQVSKIVGADSAEGLFSGNESERKSALLKWMPGGEG